MPNVLNPEIAEALAGLAPPDGQAPDQPQAGDWQGLREFTNASLAWMKDQIPVFPDDYPEVEATDIKVGAADGEQLELRWYTKAGSTPGSAVVFVHGGGMVGGSVDLYDGVMAGYVNATGVPFLAVDYRLAPEASGTTAAQDMFRGLQWLHEHAGELGVDPKRIALMGDSAGGGITAGTAILARTNGVSVAKQVLIYPMLDDRNVLPNERLVPFMTWRYTDNITGWGALLGDLIGTEQVDPVASPARLVDFAGLPSAYIEVGDLDIFRDEDVNYAEKLMQAGIPVELHVWPGAIHGFDGLAPNSSLARQAMEHRHQVIRAI